MSFIQHSAARVWNKFITWYNNVLRAPSGREGAQQNLPERLSRLGGGFGLVWVVLVVV